MTKADEKKLEGFRKWLHNQGLQHATVNTYVCNARKYLDFMENKRLDEKSAKEFVDYLILNCKPTIVKMCVISVNKYLEFTGRTHKLKYTKPSSANKPKPLTVSEYRRLLAAAKDKEPLWLYYIIETLCASGLASAKLKHLTVEAVECGVVTYKYIGIEYSCCLPSKLCTHLKEYAKMAGIKQGAIFVDCCGKPLFRDTILNEIQKLSTKSRVDESKLTFENFIGLYEHTRKCMEREIVDRIDLLRGFYDTKENTRQTGQI